MVDSPTQFLDSEVSQARRDIEEITQRLEVVNLQVARLGDKVMEKVRAEATVVVDQIAVATTKMHLNMEELVQRHGQMEAWATRINAGMAKVEEFSTHVTGVQNKMEQRTMNVETMSTNLNTRMATVEANAGGYRGHRPKGYLPEKRMIPDVLDDEIPKWRRWRESTMDCLVMRISAWTPRSSKR